MIAAALLFFGPFLLLIAELQWFPDFVYYLFPPEALAGPPQTTDPVEEFLGALRETLVELGGRTVVIASADLAHVGPQFGAARPVTPGQLREVEDADRRTLAAVETEDSEDFFREVAKDGDRRHICGLPPIYAALRVLGRPRGRLLRYGQWADPNGTVTFAALALYGPE